MPNINLTVHMGHMTRDPEVRYTPSGQAVCEFGLAMNRQWKTESGEKREKPVFIDFQAWGPTAEAIGKHCSQGDTIHVMGSMDMDQWEDKQTGQKRSRLFVRVDGVQFIKIRKWIENPREPEKAPERPHDKRYVPTRPEPPRDPDLDPSEEDSRIPF